MESQDNKLPGEIMDRQPLVAYFSMEVGLEAGMPTHAGGLGVLAGDMNPAGVDVETEIE